MTSHPKFLVLGLCVLKHCILELRVNIIHFCLHCLCPVFCCSNRKVSHFLDILPHLGITLRASFLTFDQSDFYWDWASLPRFILCSHSKTGLQVQLIFCFRSTQGPNQHHSVKSVNNSSQEWLRTEHSWPGGYPALRHDLLRPPFLLHALIEL